jgi:hypothetical protein
MEALTTTRRALIDYGRYVATEIARAHGTVHSRDVRRALEQSGVLTPSWGGREHWIGAIFNASDFEWTGAFHAYRDDARNIHERTVKVWRLRPGASGYSRPPDTPPYPRELKVRQIEMF